MEAYDPRYFDEDHLFNTKGLLGWVAQRRKRAIAGVIRNTYGQLSEHTRILDVGCGYGEILAGIAGGRKYGVDINYKALVESRRKVGEGDFLCGDAGSQPFRPMTFDVIICSEVLEHTCKPSRFVEQICRLVRGEGIICVTVPNETVTMLGRFLLGKKPYRTPAHFVSLNLKRLERLFACPPIAAYSIPLPFLPFPLATNLLAVFRPNADRKS